MAEDGSGAMQDDRVFSEGIAEVQLNQTPDTNEYGWHKWVADLPGHENAIQSDVAFITFVQRAARHARDVQEKKHKQ
jgi:hypothetical protein